MSIVLTLFIALGLAMDACAVSVVGGLRAERLEIGNALKIAIFFGLFQAVMPVIGWLIGFSLREFISRVDHWIAFGLLAVIGCKMILESMRTGVDKTEVDLLNLHVLLILSVATSIDALVVGTSLSLLRIPIVIPAIVIGMVTFLLSFLAVSVGNRAGQLFGNKIKIIGGLILIGIGTKILIEHLAHNI